MWVARVQGFRIQPPHVPQVVITASQIQWTADVTKCLLTAKERGDKKILKVMKKKQVGNSTIWDSPGIRVGGKEVINWSQN